MNSLEKNAYYVPAESAASSAVELWKRVLDVTFIVLISPILIPLSLFIAAVIKLVSPGPALFKHERIGLNGKPFLCLKFRTMVVNADTSGHQLYLSQLIQKSNVPMVKMDSKGDKRLIRFGRLIRASGLDELPQFLNVLRGEMSIVGPRPCIAYEYKSFLPWHRRRCDTLPGLTGLWQVSGKNNTTFEKMMELDIWYARNKTLGLDLLIIAKTIPAILIQVKEMIERSRSAPSVEPTSPLCQSVRPEVQ